MDDVTRVIATTGEISLKGENRRWFEKALTTNVAKALADLPVAAVKRPSWRVLVELSEPVPFREVARRLSTVFGLGAIMAVEHAGRDLDAARAAIGRRLAGLAPASFAVRCTRSDKRFPMTSPDIEAELGAFVGERTGWPVDLSSPDLTVNLLVDENGFWLWLDKVPGPGGLPVGVGGRATCLLSGGIDSPVAAYLMMKRGMRLDFVHFHSVAADRPRQHREGRGSGPRAGPLPGGGPARDRAVAPHPGRGHRPLRPRAAGASVPTLHAPTGERAWHIASAPRPWSPASRWARWRRRRWRTWPRWRRSPR